MTKKKTLQVQVLARFMSEKTLDDLVDEYNRNRTYSKNRPVTPLDRKIYKDYKAGMMSGELMRKYNKSYSGVTVAVYKVAGEK